MPDSEHALCLWHVDKNVLANCKSSFDTEEAWKAFYDDWHKVLHANTEPVFEERWAEFQTRYKNNYWDAIDYLRSDLMEVWKRKDN